MVVAIEPGAKQFQRLTENLEENGVNNVEVKKCAVSDRTGEILLYIDENDDSLDRIATIGAEGAVGITTVAITLDEVASERQFAMAKVDVEGAEPLVIKGATEMLLDRNPPVWQLELGGYSKRYGVDSGEIIQYMQSYNYVPAIYFADKKELLYTDRPWEYKRNNTLFISRDKKDWVERRISEF